MSLDVLHEVGPAVHTLEVRWGAETPTLALVIAALQVINKHAPSSAKVGPVHAEFGRWQFAGLIAKWDEK